MRIAFRKPGGGTKRAAVLHVHTPGGTVKATRAHIRTLTGPKIFFQSLSGGGGGGGGGSPDGITISTTRVSAATNSANDAEIGTREVSVFVGGGVPPYTYDWNQVDGDVIDIHSPTAATTFFSATVSPGETKTGSFSCTVTDAAGVSGDSPEVTVTLRNGGGFAA